MLAKYLPRRGFLPLKAGFLLPNMFIGLHIQDHKPQRLPWNWKENAPALLGFVVCWVEITPTKNLRFSPVWQGSRKLLWGPGQLKCQIHSDLENGIKNHCSGNMPQSFTCYQMTLSGAAVHKQRKPVRDNKITNSNSHSEKSCLTVSRRISLPLVCDARAFVHLLHGTYQVMVVLIVYTSLSTTRDNFPPSI